MTAACPMPAEFTATNVNVYDTFPSRPVRLNARAVASKVMFLSLLLYESVRCHVRLYDVITPFGSIGSTHSTAMEVGLTSDTVNTLGPGTGVKEKYAQISEIPQIPTKEFGSVKTKKIGQ